MKHATATILGWITFLALAVQPTHGFERIDPRGVIGTLIVSPSAQMDRDCLDAFVKEIESEDEVLVVATKDALSTQVADIASACHAIGVSRIQVQLWNEDTKIEARESDPSIRQHVWIAGDPEFWSDFSEFGRIILENRGTVAFSGRCARFAFTESRDSADGDPAEGWSLIPESLRIARSFKNVAEYLAAKKTPIIAFHIPESSCLIVQGRRFKTIGNEPSMFHLPKSSHQNQTQFEISIHPFDLTAQRRACRTRLNWPFGNPGLTTLKNGSLVICGGGKLSDEVIQRFVHLAGGEDASVVVFPTAAPDPLPRRHWIVGALKKAGVSKIDVLAQRQLQEVESDAVIETLNKATAIWFGGGRQWRFVDAYQDTKAFDAIRRLLDRGGVIGGSSAGASIQAEYLARGNPLGNLEIMSEGYEQGFGFLPGVAIDQHLTQRNRLPGLKSLVKRFPQYMGIGIDESTALVVANSQVQILGTGDVYFVSSHENDLSIHKKDAHDEAFTMGDVAIPVDASAVTKP